MAPRRGRHCSGETVPNCCASTCRGPCSTCPNCHLRDGCSRRSVTGSRCAATPSPRRWPCCRAPAVPRRGQHYSGETVPNCCASTCRGPCSTCPNCHLRDGCSRRSVTGSRCAATPLPRCWPCCRAPAAPQASHGYATFELKEAGAFPKELGLTGGGIPAAGRSQVYRWEHGDGLVGAHGGSEGVLPDTMAAREHPARRYASLRAEAGGHAEV